MSGAQALIPPLKSPDLAGAKVAPEQQRSGGKPAGKPLAPQTPLQRKMQSCDTLAKARQPSGYERDSFLRDCRANALSAPVDYSPVPAVPAAVRRTPEPTPPTALPALLPPPED